MTTRVAEPLLTASLGGASRPRRRAKFHTLKIAEVRPLTDAAVEVTLVVPDELAAEYEYRPGQHVALRANVDGHELRRSYSLCRPAARGSLSFAIKKDAGGRFSTWAQTALRPGDEIDVMSPQGMFTSNLAEFDGAHIAGVAAGSGITPMMALASTVLSRSETSRVTLIYTNRSTTDVMFVEELADLKDKYPSRLALHHVLSREQRTAPLLSGRLDAERMRSVLNDLVMPDTVDEWFLCGPMDLVQLCRGELEDRGVDRKRVRYELFTAGERDRHEPSPTPVDEVRDGDKVYALDFTLDGTSSTVQSPIAARESILTAALRVRSDVPFACAGGVCGTCRARLLAGSVAMTESYALEPDEIERGYVLTCQSHPTSDRVAVDYDV
jgi:ring-1,2-phenylacetyl-CoA epoxidase subunit PaaE